MEAKIDETTALLAAIIDSSDDAIISKTLDGVILSWNRGAEKIFGYTADEAIGQHITLIIPAERHAEESEVLSRIRRGEKVDHFETVRQAKDGHRVDISLTVSPIRNSSGKLVGASKVARDITERKRAEQEKEELLGREMAARREAQQANNLKDEFLAILSHELRSPLTAIVGWTSLLRTGKLDPFKTSRALETIQRNAQAQDQLISDLLDVSQIVGGRLRLNLRPFAFATVIEAAVDVIRPAAEAKGVRLQVLIDAAAGPVSGDPDRLQQVFWNLLSNAVKFTPRGGRVQVRVRRINSNVEIVVDDTGIGIRPEMVSHVFDRFRQGDATFARDYGGLGLGLAIVRSLVELHGGTVRAESAGQGKGAVFTVLLPVMNGSRAATVEEPVLLLPDSNGNVGPHLNGLRVLVVDDEADARDIISTIFAQAQAEVRTAESTSDALDVLKEWQPDVLVSDIGMPKADGYELIRRVRECPRERGGRIPAIALTAYARVEDRLRLLSSGYQMHVPKPVRPAELLTVVASVVNRA